MITRTEFIDILEDTPTKLKGDTCFKGLLIISKYIDTNEKDIIECVSYELLYSVDVDVIIESGITKEDTIKLAELGWLVDSHNDCLTHYI